MTLLLAIALHVLPRRATLGAAVRAENGIRVAAVLPGTPADRGGLKVGDVITAVGDTAESNVPQFLAHMKAEPAGVPIDFHVRRGEETLTLPITLTEAPKEPGTIYGSVEVDGTLRRTLLTLPKNATRSPAVLIIGGIGCYSIDNAADANDAYMHLAHDLANAGIAVMRLEKSGVGDSQGPPCMTVDFNSEMHSYAVALDALEHDEHVDPNRVYLFGHSIGTVIAPRIVDSAAGIIAADGVGRNWFEYELANSRRQLELDATPPAEADADIAKKELCMHRFLIEKQESPADCKQYNSYPASDAYMQQVAALNIAEPWTRVSVPVLVIYGTSDFITAQDDHERIARIAKNATLKLMPGMDHYLDVAPSQQADWDMRTKQHAAGPYDVDLSKVVADWVLRQSAH